MACRLNVKHKQSTNFTKSGKYDYSLLKKSFSGMRNLVLNANGENFSHKHKSSDAT